MNRSTVRLAPVADVFLRLFRPTRLLVLSLILLFVSGFIVSQIKRHVASSVFASAGAPGVQTLATMSETVTVHAAGRGKPYINFSDGREVLTGYGATSNGDAALQSPASPLAMASADFDEDGVPDLVSGYSVSGGGMLILHRGNVDSVYPNAPEARQRRATGLFTDAPFLSPARVFDLPAAADFVGAGDFDADGHWDVVIANRGDNALHFLAGDGKGNFGSALRIELPGRATAMAVGEVNRVDGLNDLVVGVATASGPRALVFESPDGALRGKPESFELPDEATAIAIGNLDAEYTMDIAIAAGHELLMINGRDRKLSLDEKQQATVPKARTGRRAFSFGLKSVAIGDFKGDHNVGLAVLADQGSVHLLSADSAKAKKKGIKKWKDEVWASGSWAQATQMVIARVSSVPSDDLVIVDGLGRKLHIVAKAAALQQQAQSVQSVSFDVEDQPMAVMPMRLNSTALRGLVILRNGQVGPTLMTPQGGSSFTVTTNQDSGAGSLRDAINQANTSPGLDTIDFAIGFVPPINSAIGTGPQTITPTSALPQITDAVIIDGTTQPGFAGTPIIEINGSGVSFANGLNISAGNSTVRGLLIDNFGPDAGNVGGIRLLTNGNNIIEGNFLTSNRNGVKIDNASGNRIGGTSLSASNELSGNGATGSGGSGVLINTGSGNVIQGNLLGTDPSGTVAFGNFGSNVRLFNVTGTLIGGTVAGARNVISASVETFGINLLPLPAGPSDFNLVQGNFIGTDVNGTAALGNALAGIQMSGTNNTVGGTTPAARNVISASGIGNVAFGISIFGGNFQVGPSQFINSPATGNVVQGNYIGTNAAGTAPLGNGSDGILIQASQNVAASNNAIGGAATGAGNLIAFNGGNGITLSTVDASPLSSNSILSNSIFSNAGLGIDLTTVFPSDLVTANDACDTDSGPNNLQNSPVLSLAFLSGTRVNIQGTLNSTANTTFTVQFFANSGCDPSGFGEGETPIGSTQVTTDANCNASFTFLAAGAHQGQSITATATDPAGNTSEFSNCIAIGTGALNLALTKSVSPTAVRPGNNVTYTITVTNNGPAVAHNVVVTDNLPAQVTFVSCSASVGSCGGSGNSRSLAVPLLALNGTATLTLVATVSPSATNGTVINNTANVTAVLGDLSATATASAAVTVSTQAPAINCPPNVLAAADQGQTSAVLNYPAPTVVGNPANVSITCAPPSGSSFPVGTTTVNCTAKDAANNTSSCSFSVTVNQENPSVIPNTIDLVNPFGVPTQNPPTGTFTITNVSTASIDLTLTSIRRIGSAGGRITNLDDSRFFTVFVVNPGGADVRFNPGSTIPLPTGKRDFRVTFNPSIPAVASGTSNLSASQVLPDVVTTSLNFVASGGGSLTVTVIGHVATGLLLIDPANPTHSAVVTFSRSGNQFNLTYSVFDSNLNVTRASHQFLDSGGQPSGQPVEVNLAQALQAINLVKGQSFTVDQPFTGASSHPEIAGVRVTVFDGETSVSATASGGGSQSAGARIEEGGERITMRLRAVRLRRRTGQP